MITFRPAGERRYERHPEREDWLTFHPEDPNDPLARGFRSLATLREARFGPLAGVRQPREESEIITYVREGVLAFEDSMGRAGLIRAGEFQRITVGRGIRFSETNTSPSSWAHVFQIWLRSSVIGLTSDHEQRRFSAAVRRGGLCIVASPDGRLGSLLVHQDSCLYSALLQRGQHVVHEVAPGRAVWLHVVDGCIDLGTLVLNRGDGVGITDEPTVSLTAHDDAEVLLLDLCPTTSGSSLITPGGTEPRCVNLTIEEAGRGPPERRESGNSALWTSPRRTDRDARIRITGTRSPPEAIFRGGPSQSEGLVVTMSDPPSGSDVLTLEGDKLRKTGTQARKLLW